MIYLDHAATTPLDKNVLNKMLPYMQSAFGNPSSQHSLGRGSANAVIASRDKTAVLIGCAPNEVYFTSGGTECGNWAVKGACLERGKGHILVSAIEHPCVKESAYDLQKLGFTVEEIPPDSNGVISAKAVEERIREDTVFCAVMHANNETGVIQPVEEIGALLKERGIFYYCDCVQTAGVLPLPVKSCTALGISAHKFYGPSGAGAFYLEKGAKIARLFSGGRQEKGLRGGTLNTPQIVGLAEALSLAYQTDYGKVEKLKNKFVKGVLSGISGSHLNGGGKILPAHANISFDGCDGANLLFLLDMAGVAVSTGSACSAGAVTPSAVISSMAGEKRAKSAVRFSFGKDNAEREVDEVLAILKRCVDKIRNC